MNAKYYTIMVSVTFLIPQDDFVWNISMLYRAYAAPLPWVPLTVHNAN